MLAMIMSLAAVTAASRKLRGMEDTPCAPKLGG
jgi:hypothetical protein